MYHLDHNFSYFACFSKQEKQWVFKRSFCVQGSDKVYDRKPTLIMEFSIIHCAHFAAFSTVVGNNKPNIIINVHMDCFIDDFIFPCDNL